MLVATIFYGTYQSHFTIDLGVKGLNLTTLLFVLGVALVASLRQKERTPTPLKGSFSFFFLALIWAFVVGQLRGSGTAVDDLAVVKNVMFAMLLYFVAFHASGDRGTRETVFIAILFVTALVTVHVWRQAIDYGLGVYNETRRASGPFGPTAASSNRAAAFFIVYLPVMLVGAFHLRVGWQRVFAAIFTALGVAGVFFTYSRQAYFAIALLFIYASYRRHLILALCVVALVLSYETWAPEGVVDRVQMTQKADADGEQVLDESTQSRFDIWEGALEIIARNPLGIGLNQFQREIGDFLPNYAGFDAHNGYLRFTTEAGLFGGAAMLVLLTGLLLLSRRLTAADAKEDMPFLGNAFFVSVVGVIFSNLYGSRFFDADIMTAFWILAGTSARHMVVIRRSKAQ